MIRSLVLAVLTFTQLLACSSEPGGGAGSSGSGGGSGSGGSSGSGGGSGTGASAGTSGGGTAGTGATGGSSGADCSGTFRVGQVIVAQPGLKLSSPSITADELELFYVGADADGVERIWSTRRASATDSFPPGSEVAELNAACAPAELRTIDVSDDGLRAYVWCSTVFGAGQLWVGSRTNRDEPFVVPATPVQTDIGPSFAVSSDELTGVSSGMSSDVTPWVPLLYTRSSVSGAFAVPVAVPGLEAVTLNAPDLSSDALVMVGAASGALVTTTRSSPSAAFGPTEVMMIDTGLQSPDGSPVYFGAPQLSTNCRSLYFVTVIGTDWVLTLAHRE